MASTYDEALAEALGDEESELAERLRDGKADASDRLAALEQLEDDTRHRFELAHPVAPAETAVEIDAGEVAVGDVEKRVKEIADENDGREVLVRMAIRVEPEAD
jgi:hypothetical protein